MWLPANHYENNYILESNQAKDILSSVIVTQYSFGPPQLPMAHISKHGTIKRDMTCFDGDTGLY